MVGIREANTDNRPFEYRYVGTDVAGVDHIFRAIDNTLFRIHPDTGEIRERFSIPDGGIDEYVGKVRDEGQWRERKWDAQDENGVVRMFTEIADSVTSTKTPS